MRNGGLSVRTQNLVITDEINPLHALVPGQDPAGLLVHHGALEAHVLPGQHPGATVGAQLLVTERELISAIYGHVLGQVEESGRTQNFPAVHLVAGRHEIFVEFIFEILISHSKRDSC